uniref:Uncharacterized protein n=1 Tax=Candidatus Kentrum sp. LFY TaxID=2126342 RepID=A0A450UTU2_9GAMM|nr:MAG: hypothetical protein BECKLFY1418A_GA0070994_10318 [Candidatus Kentron sp. LFY]VFJ95979.1 MAG: hypothetical protein BECKLFY1418B_GA0070995_10774 [Candidatus Kentron sp. LFY]VFK18705.1 MAG: hypothetical protein BECKLFY1418C_GA0070996_104711 [Candidatus Kentron sp. LFY]
MWPGPWRGIAECLLWPVSCRFKGFLFVLVGYDPLNRYLWNLEQNLEQNGQENFAFCHFDRREIMTPVFLCPEGFGSGYAGLGGRIWYGKAIVSRSF